MARACLTRLFWNNRFRGDTIFRDNRYLPIDNIDGGYIRYDGRVPLVYDITGVP